MEPHIGEIKITSYDRVPNGWLVCNGQKVAVSEHQQLYKVIGNTYGGNETHFNLPDLRNRTPIHFGQAEGLSNCEFGEQLGAAKNEEQLHLIVQPSLTVNFIIATSGYMPNDYLSEAILGEVKILSFTDTPLYWMSCNGQEVLVEEHPELFKLIGTTYGGNGTTHFKLPDMRGRAALGPGWHYNRTEYELGQKTGSETAPGQLQGGKTHSNIQPALALNFAIATAGIYPNPDYMHAESLLGEIRLFAAPKAPDNWQNCIGQLMNLRAFMSLFYLLKTKFGGDGNIGFSLPDLHGRVPVGAADNNPVGNLQGSETTTNGQHIHSIMQPSITLNYIVNISGGIFPYQ